MKKRIWAVLLALCMVLTLLPGAALASEEPDGSGEATDPSELTADELGMLRGGVENYDPSTEPSSGPVVVDFTKNAGIAAYAETGADTQPGVSSARYTVMVLDCSGSMSGRPMESMKEAAKLFCRTVTAAAGDNYVAIVPFDSSLGTVTDFTKDLTVLEAAIDRLYAGGGTDLNSALVRASSLLENSGIPEDAYLRNILLLSDGLPQSGATSEEGTLDVTYTPADAATYYRYANACIKTADEKLWPAYRVYTLGFLHDVSGSLKKFCARFLDDLANGSVGGTYVEVTNPNDLSFIFGTDIAGAITQDPSVPDDEDPIVVVPGITGSKLYSDPACTTQVWPAASADLSALAMGNTLYVDAAMDQNHTGTREYGANDGYQALVDRLCTQFPDRQIYFFNYDWRQSSAASAASLSDTIDSILTATGAQAVDLVGHSMGALVAAKYYQQYGNAKVDKIVSCAAPFEGTPEAVYQAANGSLASVASTLPSVAELVPSNRYIPLWRDMSDFSTRLSATQRDAIFENIFGTANYASAQQNAQAYTNLLNYPKSYFVSGTDNWTITSIEFGGMNGSSVTDLRYSRRGDGTVPYSSATLMLQTEQLDSSRRLAFATNHSGVVTNRNCLSWIVNVLRRGAGIGASTTPNTAGITVVRVACPVDVSITSGSETLNASNPTTSFGRMDVIGENNDIKMLCLDGDTSYSAVLTTNDQFTAGDTMDFAVRYYDGNGVFEMEKTAEDVVLTENGTLTANIPASAASAIQLTGGAQAVPVDENKTPSEFVGYYPPDIEETAAAEEEDGDTYYISIPSVDNGQVIPSVRYAAYREQVTLNVHPAAGYALDEITVTDIRGRNVTLRETNSGTYTFYMPACRVEVKATFTRSADPSYDPTLDEPFTGLGTPGISGIVLNPAAMPFTDVKGPDWFYDYVEYMWKHYLMSGVSDTQFSPNTTTSRGMIWTILARMNNVRTDINPGSTWYEKGMLWSMEQGLTDGSNAMGDITREQLATMLWRNAGKPLGNGDLSRFSDSDSVSSYASTAVSWAVGNGILNGTDGKLNPQGTATRAEVAAMVARYGDKLVR